MALIAHAARHSLRVSGGGVSGGETCGVSGFAPAKLRSVRFRNCEMCEMRNVRFRNCEMCEMRNVQFRTSKYAKYEVSDFAPAKFKKSRKSFID